MRPGLRLGGAAAAALLVGLAGVAALGWSLARPVNAPVAMPPGFEPVIANGTHGSLLRTPGATQCALLMHGIRADRRAMAARAGFLREAGFTALAIDLQGHGETPGEMITFGHREARDASNGVAYLRSQGCRMVLAIGQSLGGAAALLGDGPVAADAVVLESVYPTIEDAVANRLGMRFGAAGRLAAPLLYLQIPLRTGIGRNQLRPLDAVRKLRVPVLVAGGTRDQHTPPHETVRLFEAAPGPKELWLVEGAAHEDLYAFDPVQYRARLAAFLTGRKPE
ncbi:alpha/beta hydrolase [Pseudoduganella sp.]|uniref:alpha/beta hydrolase n=1 Tax=Pseudoduganella sp. TaxID=1880898 RepID=UPI0035B145BD